MEKLEGYVKVALVKYKCYPYYFAIYDDGIDYHVGDLIVVSGKFMPSRITEILSIDEVKKRARMINSITGEVISKVDTSAYDKRVAWRRKEEELREKLDRRKKKIQCELDDEYYASKDEQYAEILKQYKDLCVECRN